MNPSSASQDQCSLDETHDPQARSWLASANRSGEFPIQNLPFAIFRRRGSSETFRGGVAIGDQIVDLAALAARDVFQEQAAQGIRAGALTSLNTLMQLGPEVANALRRGLFAGLLEGSRLQGALEACLVPQRDAQYSLPAQIGDYTDFYTSIHHATAVGRMMRPDHPLMPNYQWIPIGYHGRVSSIGVSGQTFHRPRGQKLPAGTTQPVMAAAERMDYELELGVFVGRGNDPGAPIAMAQAEAHIFGLCLLNDWSARDIQGWEYQPLGPFLGKNFATTVSPWIVGIEALAPFRAPAFARPAGDPQPMVYLDDEANRNAGAIDMQLEVLLLTQQMRAAGEAPTRLSSSNFKDSYWTVAQMVAHHTVGGCDLNAGDLFGSGTMSGPGKDQYGSLLELSWGGKNTLMLPNGETRTFLQDGDSVILRAHCQREGYARVGFGDCAGTLLPAIP
ncbi:MAG TPA: fumarylacetoacetase [Burkholderiales bacterium]